MADVQLKHGVYEGDATLYFYEGELQVVDGIATIPSGRPEWFTVTWRRGYQIDPKTGQPADPDECLARLSATETSSKEEGISAKSA